METINLYTFSKTESRKFEESVTKESGTDALSNGSIIQKTYCLFLIALLILTGCSVTEHLSQENNGLVVIDVDKNYKPAPILLKVDSMEFIPLETNADFLCAEGKIIAFTDELIIYSNADWIGSDILVFDAKGKALKKINRRGPSGEEYSYKKEVVYKQRGFMDFK